MTRRGTRVLGTLFFSIFALVGLGFGMALVWAFAQTVSVWTWDEVPCEIEFSKIVDHGTTDDRYELEVEYAYQVAGRTYRGESIDPSYTGSSDPSATQRLAERYGAGTTSLCRVDPRDPGRSHLRPPSLWLGFAILVPLIFVAAGVGGIHLLWKPQPTREETKSAERFGAERETVSISRRARGPRLSWALFSWVFFLAGAGFGLFFALPGLRVVQARGWDETPCEILESDVATHSGDDGSTYSVEVLYRYEVEGRDYRSNRYRFLGGSSSGYESKQEVVERLPPGRVTTCWVDPDDPYEAVLDRGLGWEFLFALLPLVFILIGAPGVARSIGRTFRRAAGAVVPSTEIEHPVGFREATPEEEVPAHDDSPYRPSPEPKVLEPAMGPIGKLVALTFFALVWNGILSIFLWFLWEGWRQGNMEWFLTLFLTPFVLIGLMLLLGIPFQILALANPRPRLTLTPGSPRLGGTGRLDWRFQGAANRLRGLEIRLEGKEESTRGGGKSSHTSSEIFHAVEIVGRDSLLDYRQGSVGFEIPADVMHSFAGSNNRVVWRLKIRGWIRFWPDVMEEFEIQVVPPERNDV